MTLAPLQLDELWDFGDAAASEGRLVAAAAAATDDDERAELETQIARALGLQARYARAHAVLDTVTGQAPAAAVRVALERGRLHNSAGDAQGAIVHFRRAADAAASAGLVFLYVDALHMLAIADPSNGDRHTAAAFAALEDVTDARTQRWRVSLHNNAGWAAMAAGRHGDALVSFHAARADAARWGTAQQIEWADESLAECRAALGDEA
ncbi:MAG: hypothetical protein CMH36_07095 [Microbacterium sp.]|uniref:Tetratricopeptide repeat protein n=1 Tax=Microbacterium ginsengisoli TaxID=400772 RepID=A0A3C1KB27_9MICO|nr:hypothetical protein [Microbacterium sp. 4NA327F11]MAL06577.1 hypothetical protein [Microbacterium sp.]MBN9208287.1 hypothetical protein [Microbacterium ginsengisoli]MCK9915449.1 hypothetical protein [Microbacteriaceae bacterium K1510]ODU77297.1 MAG: hypothetical protein ABT08_07095 [Microbacterium sp. SCN 71-21]HAN23865.1 hypothetical protein [Microbacterium ginsengisoli]